MTNLDSIAPESEVHIEAHGSSALAGRPHRPIARESFPHLFDDAMWLTAPSRAEDLHAAFVSDFVLAEPETVRIDVQAAANFALWVDGERVVAGPFRFVPAVPEYTSLDVSLAAGPHRIALEAQHEGISHRTTTNLPPFVWCRVVTPAGVVPLAWRCRELLEYTQTGLRVSPLLGWVEWRNLRGRSWLEEDISSPEWDSPGIAHHALAYLGAPMRSDAQLPTWQSMTPTEIARGRFRDTFTGYTLDDLSTQFLLSDPAPPTGEDDDGMWLRFDLGRVRLGYVACSVTLEHPGRVTIAYAERLTPGGRPSPVVALSTGPTRMIQVFDLPAGTSQILPFQSLGGRWVEIRVATAGRCDVREVTFVERDYMRPPTGTFTSSSARLNQIWQVGLDTLRASSEDAIVDAIRERGEWLGDVISSALRIGASGWGNTDLVRRALLHAAAGAREDGLIPGCGPGELIYLGTYSAHFMSTCVELAMVERDDSILRQLEGPARSNMEAILALVAPDGTHQLPWGFVDWGYVNEPGRVDVAVLCHVVAAVDSWMLWQELLNVEASERKRWKAERDRLAAIIRQALAESAPTYHAMTLAFRVGLAPAEDAVAAIVAHVERGFPIDPQGSRLRDPTQGRHDAFTPYFTHYSFAVLLENGAGELVRRYWETAWGWMLVHGATTWWEVFDDRWSQCHSWSGSPTWQLSEFVLGLQPRADSRGFYSRLRVNTVGLDSASGMIPVAGTDAHVSVAWTRSGSEVELMLDTAVEIAVEHRGEIRRLTPGSHRFVLTHDRGDIFH
ncbi:hypothetical protein BH10ACT7_BH10ACT7_29670 [soil metagenome]